MEWRGKVARTKVRRFKDWDYWGKPVPGFGDPDAWLLIIGLAPAAHGANRTGRMFTGDDSGNWLYRALYETGFANQPTSTSVDDGLRLTGCYITATCRCAPPQNKVTPAEIRNCSSYLVEELRILKNIKVILCLGRVAFDSFCRLNGLKGMEFAHGRTSQLPLQPSDLPDGKAGLPDRQAGSLKGEPHPPGNREVFSPLGAGGKRGEIRTLIASYHPSRQNTQTGKLKWSEWLSVFRNIRKTGKEANTSARSQSQ